VLIVTFDPPENVGGVEGRVEGYVRELTKEGHAVEVEAFAPGYHYTLETFNGVSLYKCSSRVKSLFRSLAYTRRVITRDSIDSVFLLSGGLTILGNLLLLYCRLTGRRTATLLYGKDILQARKSRTGRALLSGAQRLSKKVVTNSLYTASLLPSIPRKKLAVLTPSVNPLVLEQMESSAPVAPMGRRILCVGRLVQRKGIDDLIRALPLVIQSIPDVTLEVVGDGPDRPRLESLALELGMGPKVHFFGNLRGRQLFERYASCDVFAMPSRTLPDDVEGFGTVFLEAGLVGKPSVGTRSGGIPEAIVDGETGILVKEGDVKALASALEHVLLDSDLNRRLGENARSRVLKEFTWDRSAQRLMDIFSSDPTSS
jgi:glycosyltransferase involved in cell wall biosynthesis